MRYYLTGILLILMAFTNALTAQTNINNVNGRNKISLNGKWKIIIDPLDAGIGNWLAIWKDRKPSGKHDFYEYSFDNGPELSVPGDFNSQLPELTYYESTIWYKKTFNYTKKNNRRLFIHFGAVNYKADVFINSQKIGSHEGGFTSFAYEITDFVRDGENAILVRCNNARVKNGIPGMGFDWFNYGGITADVNLIEEPASFIADYFIQLKKGTADKMEGWIRINGNHPKQRVRVEIPQIGSVYSTNTDTSGMAHVLFSSKPQLWTSSDPKLYTVKISCETDSVTEKIGFRSIEAKDGVLLLNHKPIFLKGVNIHEEIPQERRRAYSEKDAIQLLSWAKELGCNFVRLVHYPHNEWMLRTADSMGLMVWSEIPVYQGIDFQDSSIQKKMNGMVQEMVDRDKNRCSIIIWSMSNETSPTNARTRAIGSAADLCRSMDPTRLISSAINNTDFKDSMVSINDTLINKLDVIGVNEYFGWYRPWPCAPEHLQWQSLFNKPLIMSEFGAEAMYGSTALPKDAASSWSEEYQEGVYKDQLNMFQHIPFLAGTCPWVLADFRSPVRMHPVFQRGWNRKGLLSDSGMKKKAWYVVQKFYDSK
jgi:beta-glucuronidase